MKKNINKYIGMILAMLLVTANIITVSADELTQVDADNDWYIGEVSEGEYLTFKSEEDYNFFMSKLDMNVSTLATCFPGDLGYPTCTPPSGERTTFTQVDSQTYSGSLGRASITPYNTTAKYITLTKSATYSAQIEILTKWGVNVKLSASRKQSVQKTYQNPGSCGYLQARGESTVTKSLMKYFKAGAKVPYKTIEVYQNSSKIQDYRFVAVNISYCP